MHVLYLLLSVFVGSLLVIVSSISPARTGVSTFELVRRRELGNKDAEHELRRETLIADLYSMRRLAVGVSLVAFVFMSIAAWGMAWGALVSFALAVAYGKLATLPVVHAIAMKIYEENEAPLMRVIEAHPASMRALRGVVWVESRAMLSSRQELEYLVRESQGILHEQDKRRIINSLHFNERTVEEIMTPRGVISSVKHTDIVGPYILDALHKTGHSRFPVVDEDIDHVVGVLYTRDLVTLSDKRSKTAGEVMDDHVFYINRDQTLDHALTAFLKTHRHMFIVVNEYRETAGVLTLEDTMEALLGYKIIDEFDQHDDLRAVADRMARRNNNPPHATNV